MIKYCVQLNKMFRIILLILCVSSIGGVVARSEYGYKYYPNIDGYLKIHTIPSTWDNAMKKCLADGGVLASPVSEDMSRAMKSAMNSSKLAINCGVFTGVHSTYTNGDFYTIEGVPFHQPPTSKRDQHICKTKFQNYMVLLADGSYDDANENDSFPFICYRKKQDKKVSVSCDTYDSAYIMDSRSISCYKFHTEAQTWSQAAKTCATEGGHLAIINNQVESLVLQEIFAKYPANLIVSAQKNYIWIGFQNWKGQGIWTTVFGLPLLDAGHMDWSSGQPKNAELVYDTAQHLCGVVNRLPSRPHNTLDVLQCESYKLSFICERPPRVDEDGESTLSTVHK